MKLVAKDREFSFPEEVVQASSVLEQLREVFGDVQEIQRLSEEELEHLHKVLVEGEKLLPEKLYIFDALCIDLHTIPFWNLV
jgi:hypothetical protein